MVGKHFINEQGVSFRITDLFLNDTHFKIMDYDLNVSQINVKEFNEMLGVGTIIEIPAPETNSFGLEYGSSLRDQAERHGMTIGPEGIYIGDELIHARPRGGNVTRLYDYWVFFAELNDVLTPVSQHRLIER